MQGKNQFDQDTWSSRTNDSAHRGRDRRGIRAGDLVREAAFDNDVSNPRVEIPLAIMKGRTFARQNGIEITDRLTAADQALWHYLFARAKDHINGLPLTGGDAGFKDKHAYGGHSLVHEVKVADMLAYVGSHNPQRLRESLGRLSETEAHYDIRYRRTRLTRPVRYMTIHSMPAKLKSRDVIRYEIDPEVRVSMLMTRRFTTIDLNALTKFKSRYSARLFSRLSLMASRHQRLLTTKTDKCGKVGLNKRYWIIAPEDLARELGYPMHTYRMQTFVSAMTRALAEITALPLLNRRFDVLFVLPTAAVPRFSFAVTEARKSVFDVHRGWIGRNAFFHATAHNYKQKRAAIKMTDGQFVHVTRVAQAQAFYGVDAWRITSGWRADVEGANAGRVTEVAGWPAGEFLARIEKFGPEAAFEAWLAARAPAWIDEIAEQQKAKVVIPKLVPDVMPMQIDEVVYYERDDDDEDLRIGDDWGNLGVYSDAA